MLAQQKLPVGHPTIVFFDTEKHTKSLQRLGNTDYTIKARNPLFIKIEELRAKYQGVQYGSHSGDSMMHVFPLKTNAIKFAKELQLWIKEDAHLPSYTAPDGKEYPFAIRMGIHSSIIEMEEMAPGDYGSHEDINYAARVMSAGVGGQILLSEETHRHIEPQQYPCKEHPNRRIKDWDAQPHTLFEFLYDKVERAIPGEAESGTAFFPKKLASIKFVDPENVIHELHKTLKKSWCVALVGMGGIGKTTTANRYAAEFKQNNYYKDVITVNAQSPANLLEQFHISVSRMPALAEQIRLAEEYVGESSGEKFYNEVKIRVLNVLQERQYANADKPYLLIYQGYDQVDESITDFYSSDDLNYHVLFTSREEKFPVPGVAVLAAPLMKADNAIELLYRASTNYLKTDYKTLSQEEQIAANELAFDIAGGLPLAIHAMGKRMYDDDAESFVHYRDRYLREVNTQRAVLYAESEKVNWEETDSETKQTIHRCLYWTYRASLDAATDTSRYPNGLAEAVRDFVLMFANFAPDSFPQRAIEVAAQNQMLSEALRSYLASGKTLNEVLKVADKHTLIERTKINKDGASVFMHGMIQSVLRFDLDGEEKEEQKTFAKICINHALENLAEETYLADYDQLFAHSEKYFRDNDVKEIYPALASFEADYRVRVALSTGDWSQIFLEGQEEEFTYSTLRNIESDVWRMKMRRVIASLSRAIPDDTARRQCFACIYFVAHYWWDLYFEEKDKGARHLVDPLLEAWEESHTTQADKDFVQALRIFQTNFPCVREYRRRDQKVKRWLKVYEALTLICPLLGVEIFNISGLNTEDFTASENYLYGILCLYITEAARYADETPNYRREDEAQYWEMYAFAQQFFAANKDKFHFSWSLYEEAEARREAGEYFDELRTGTQQSNQIKEYFLLAEERAKEALSIATEISLPSWEQNEDTSEQGTEVTSSEVEAKEDAQGVAQKEYQDEDTEDYESDTDAELMANSYRVLADLRWADTGQQSTVWGYYCAAVLCAYAYMESQQDEYSQQFYNEHLDRLMDRLLSLPTQTQNDWISLTLVCEFIQRFWSEYWKAHQLPIPDFRNDIGDLSQKISLQEGNLSRLALQQAIFPWTPTLEDIKEPGSPCRRCLSEVLETMPEVIKAMHPLMKPFSLDKVAGVLRTESRLMNAQFAKWVLDEETKLSLRKVRSEDIDTLVTSAVMAFGKENDGKLIRSMLEIHCKSARTIPLEDTEHTMLPTQYYVLTLKGEVIGLTGLYRTVWTNKTIFSLGWFFVDPKHWGNRYGDKLLRATMEIAKANRCSRLMIESALNLKNALDLYKEMKFEEVGVVPDYYDTDYNLLLLTRNLTDITVSKDMPDGFKDKHLHNV